jgi:PAS domain S-box-containing protein
MIAISMGKCRNILYHMQNLNFEVQMEKQLFLSEGYAGKVCETEGSRLLKKVFCGKEVFVPGDFHEDAMVSYTKDLIINSWSKSAEKLLGYQEEEIIGAKIDKLIPVSRRREYIDIVKRLRQGEVIKNCETSRKHKNGSIIDVAISMIPYYTCNGEFYGVIVTYRDNSDRLILMDQLKDSEERWRNAIQGGKFGVWEWDIPNNQLMVYNNWINRLGYEENEVSNTFDYWLGLIHGDDIPAVSEKLEKAFEGEEYECEFRMKQKDGTYLWVRGKGTIIQWDKRGIPVKMIGTNEDVTNRKILEEQLVQYCKQQELLKQDAEQVSRAKTNFLSNISHEIRTPMNGIIGTLQLLQKTDVKPEQERWINLLQESVNGLLLIMNDVLDISKLESEKMRLIYHPFNLKKLANEVCNQLMVLCETKGLEMRVSLDPGIRHTAIGDKVKLKQILMNLISNAVKFTDQGYISLEAVLLYTDEDRQRIEVRVRDSGIGIAEEDMDKIFHSYMQGDLSSAKKYMGTGLGLTIAKSLANLMNGDIYVESKLGEGSTFYFICDLFRLKKPLNSIKGIKQEAVEAEQPCRCGLLDTRRKQKAVILSVEDNAINQEIIYAMAASGGYRVIPASGGEEALRILDTTRVDLILMDIQMPVMNGYELTSHIRNDSRHKHTPIIAMTACTTEADRRRCMVSGMSDFISKPVEADRFYQLCEKYIGLQNNFTDVENDPCLII